MRLTLISVGKTRGPAAEWIADYETRIRRYFTFEAVEVREYPSHQASGPEEVLREEGARLLARAPAGAEVVALHRVGQAWSSERLAGYLADAGLNATPAIAFVIGGAFGLSAEVLARARHHLSLSAMTLPHEMARLLLTEQLYRAGTIQRGEPYHKTLVG